MPDEVFSRLKVVDCGSYVAGPAAATVLADLGAEVVKIEPLSGDPLRQLAPVYPSYFWRMDSRSKKGLAVDLKTAEGREILERLVKNADVFVTNYRNSLINRLNLGYETLKVLNPRMIYAHVSGYGFEGDDAERTAFDSTAWWGRSGLQDWVRQDASEPAGNSPGMGDHATAMSLFAAIMAALYRREITGAGARVHTSLMANGAWSNSMSIQAVAAGAQWAIRHPTRRPGVTNVNQTYRTTDDRYLTLNILNHAKEYHPLLAALDLVSLLDDSRFADVETAYANMNDLVAHVDGVLSSMTLAEARTTFDKHGITYGHVQRTSEVIDDAQMWANDVMIPVADPREGWEQTVNSPLWIDGVDKVLPTCAPEIGEHSEAVLRGLGFADEEIANLVDKGVVGIFRSEAAK